MAKRLELKLQVQNTTRVRPCLQEASSRRGKADAAVAEAKLQSAQLRTTERGEAREEANRVKEVANAEAEAIQSMVGRCKLMLKPGAPRFLSAL